MKTEIPNELEAQPKSQPSKESGKKPARARKEKTDVEGMRLPVLVEFTYTASILVLLVLGLTVAGTSFLTGASLFTVVVRTGVTLLVMGGLLTAISSQVSSGLLFASLAEQEERKKAEEMGREEFPGLPPQEAAKAE